MMGRLPSLLQAASDGRGRRSRAVLEEGAAGAGELEVPPSSHPELHPAVASGRATLLEEESSDAGVGDAGSEAGVGDAGRASEGIAAARLWAMEGHRRLGARRTARTCANLIGEKAFDPEGGRKGGAELQRGRWGHRRSTECHSNRLWSERERLIRKEGGGGNAQVRRDLQATRNLRRDLHESRAVFRRALHLQDMGGGDRDGSVTVGQNDRKLPAPICAGRERS